MEHTASFPSFTKISSETVVTGSFATTSLLAGGTLGTPESPSKILDKEMNENEFRLLGSFPLRTSRAEFTKLVVIHENRDGEGGNKKKKKKQIASLNRGGEARIYALNRTR